MPVLPSCPTLEFEIEQWAMHTANLFARVYPGSPAVLVEVSRTDRPGIKRSYTIPVDSSDVVSLVMPTVTTAPIPEPPKLLSQPPPDLNDSEVELLKAIVDKGQLAKNLAKLTGLSITHIRGTMSVLIRLGLAQRGPKGYHITATGRTAVS